MMLSFSRRLLLLSFLMVAAFAHADLNARWQSALAHYQNKEFAPATSEWSEWLKEAGSQGIESSEAHYNLALCYWELGETGQAVSHLLRSTVLESSPFQVIDNLNLATGMEKEIGIKEGLSQAFFFRYAMVVDRGRSIWLSAVAFWLVIAAWLSYWLKVKFPPGLRIALVVVAVICSIIAGASYIDRRYYSNFAVLDRGKETVPVFARPKAASTSEDPLVELPSGTVVNVNAKKDTAYQIESPIVGWVQSDDLKFIWR